MTELSTPETLLMCLGAIGFGFLLLSKGGDWLIDAAVYVASKQGVSKLLIGATIVAFGTSAPEMAVSLDAAFKGFDDLSLGNVIGSNTANIMFILGVQVAIVGVVAASPQAIRRDVIAMLLASCAILGFAYMGLIPRWGGVAMIAAIVLFTMYQVLREKRLAKSNPERAIHEHEDEQDEAGREFGSQAHALAFIALGLATLVLGAKILVLGAVVGAKTIGVSEAVIGLTIVAVGTSLPELFAGLAAARKGHGDVAIGNIVGSNLFNILAILGITATAVPLTMSPTMLTNTWIMLAVTAAFSVLLLWKGKITRPVALVSIAAYAAYTVWLYYGTLS
jgi:cation:H+ antiporter